MELIEKNLVYKLNQLIDAELNKKTEEVDDVLVREAVNGILRIKKESDYQISFDTRQKSIRYILDSPIRGKHLSKAVKILLAAAIIVTLLVLSVFAYSFIEYKINNYDTFSIILFNAHGNKLDHPVEANYIPDGFNLSDSDDHNSVSMKEYVKLDGIGFSIIKDSDPHTYNFNTEYEANHSITINGIEYILYGDEEHGDGVIFVKNGYVYSVSGQLPEDELLKIAQGLD